MPENEDSSTTIHENDFAALFAASEAAGSRRQQIAVGDLVRGRVMAMGQTAAFVAIGGKGEAPSTWPSSAMRPVGR